MTPTRNGLGRSARMTIGAAFAALLLSIPANAAIIASYSGTGGAALGNSGEPAVYAPFAEFNVLGVDVYGPSPIAVGETVVYDLAGADLAAATAWLTDGVDNAFSWVQFRMGLDLVNDSYWGGVGLAEGPGVIPDLQGNVIGGIRLIATLDCADPTYRDNPCNFNDPNRNVVGLKFNYEILVSDTPFAVPEPASLALVGMGVLGTAASRWRERRTR